MFLLNIKKFIFVLKQKNIKKYEICKRKDELEFKNKLKNPELFQGFVFYFKSILLLEVQMDYILILIHLFYHKYHLYFLFQIIH